MVTLQAPIVVGYIDEKTRDRLRDVPETGWAISQGNHGVWVYGYDTKQEAIQSAKDGVSGTPRIGVVVLKRDGSYQRFIPNDENIHSRTNLMQEYEGFPRGNM